MMGREGINGHIAEAVRLLRRSSILLYSAKLRNDAVEGWLGTKPKASEEWDLVLIGVDMFNKEDK